MSDILQRILIAKRKEVELAKQKTKLSELEASTFFLRHGKSLKEVLKTATQPQIIAEFKRKSPSAGDINATASLQSVVRGYVNAGAAGLSILTDEQFFGGSLEDLKNARRTTETPILRKDFIIDEFQLYQAKAYGADVVLLIAEALNKEEVAQLSAKAKELGLEVLFEVHSEQELEKLTDHIDIVGVNNRNLSSFEVSIEQSKNLLANIPAQYAIISESGITSVDQVRELFQLGFQGFLIGSHFMAEESPAEQAEQFISSL